MSKLALYLKKGIGFLFTKEGKYTAGTFLLFLILLLLIKGCSHSEIEKTTFHIARDQRWPSINLLGKERDIGAFSDALLAAIGAEEKIKINLYSVQYDQMMNKLESEEFDGVLTAIEPDSRVKQDFIFSQPYFLLGPVLVVAKGSQLDTLDEIKYKIIGISPQSSTALEITKDYSIQLKLYDNILKALSDLNDRRIDGVIMPALQAYVYTKTFYPNQLQVATTPLTNEGLRLMTLNNEKGKTLINHFDNGLKKLKEDGKLHEMLIMWGLVNPERLQ